MALVTVHKPTVNMSETTLPDSASNTGRGNDLVSTDRDGNLTGFFFPDFVYTLLARIIIFRLLEDRDIKIIITSRGKTTGTGKTTLAILLAKWINEVRNELFGMNKSWYAEEYAFMNVWEYLRKYRQADKGDPLISDELEYMFDNRRSMSNQNTKGTQAWSILRYKNVATIGTAPGLSDLDKRIPEGADIWINVQEKGRANVYYLTVHDFEQTPIYKRLEMGDFKEVLLWNEIEKDDDYQYLKQSKKDIGVPGVDDMGNSVSEADIDTKETEVKRGVVIELLKLKEEGIFDGTQSDIGDVVGYKQPNVAKIKREEKIGS